MMLTDDQYTYRVTWSEENKEYVGLCAELASMSWLAQKPEDALAGIRAVVAEAIEDMQFSGERLPTPIAKMG